MFVHNEFSTCSDFITAKNTLDDDYQKIIFFILNDIFYFNLWFYRFSMNHMRGIIPVWYEVLSGTVGKKCYLLRLRSPVCDTDHGDQETGHSNPFRQWLVGGPARDRLRSRERGHGLRFRRGCHRGDGW